MGVVHPHIYVDRGPMTFGKGAKLVTLLVCCVCALSASTASARKAPRALLAQMQYLKVGAHGGPNESSGDIDRETQTPLIPVLGRTGGFTPDLAESPASSEFTCNDTWDVVSNEGAGVATGHCPHGTALKRTQETVPDANGHRFSGGYVQASVYNGCGYIENQNITKFATKGTSTCANPKLGYGTFGGVFNSSQIGDGTAVSTTLACTAYANDRPWSSAPAVSGSLGTVPAGGLVYWRYIVGAHGGYYWDGTDFRVMVRVSNPAWTSNVSWVFVEYYGCFGSSPNLPAGPGGYWSP
jgi:hypothetical protein